jgi:hypothetical protein
VGPMRASFEDLTDLKELDLSLDRIGAIASAP